MMTTSDKNYLDTWRDPERGIRIQVLHWQPSYPIPGQFIEYTRKGYAFKPMWNEFLMNFVVN